MDKKAVDSLVKRVVSVFAEFFPQHTYLYFPLISAALVWAIRRPEKWKEEILSWEVWPDPEFVPTKPDSFVLAFFEGDPNLAHIYQADLEKKDLPALREAFIRLYPILGLEDPFLAALFREDLETKEFRRIAQGFDTRVDQARADIEALKSRPEFLEALKTLSNEFAALSAALLSQTDVQKSLEKMVKDQVEETDA
ncbi:hypothetical protein ACFLT2_04980 [Acidobacteriota bacterium]